MTDVVPRKQHQQQQKLTTMDDDDIEDQEVESSSSSYASSSSQLPSPTPHPTPPPPPPPPPSSCGGRYCCYGGGGGGCHNIDDYGPVVVTANAVLTLAHVIVFFVLVLSHYNEDDCFWGDRHLKVERFLCFFGSLAGLTATVSALGRHVLLVAVLGTTWLPLHLLALVLLLHNHHQDDNVEDDCRIQHFSVIWMAGSVVALGWICLHVAFLFQLIRQQQDEGKQASTRAATIPEEGEATITTVTEHSPPQSQQQVCFLSPNGGKECKLCRYIPIDVTPYLKRHGLLTNETANGQSSPTSSQTTTSNTSSYYYNYYSNNSRVAPDGDDADNWASALP